jgi:hypothetical protein
MGEEDEKRSLGCLTDLLIALWLVVLCLAFLAFSHVVQRGLPR